MAVTLNARLRGGYFRGIVPCAENVFDAFGSLVFGFALPPSQRRRPRTKGGAIRERLAAFIERHPGERLWEISDQVGANRGTTKYHLRMLERDQNLRVLRTPTHSRYFPASTDPKDLALLAVLMRGRVREVARSIIGKPGSAQYEITGRLRISRKVFREYANILVDRHLVEEVREPHLRTYFPTPKLKALMEQLPEKGPRREIRL